MKIFVTGGTGAIGRHAVQALVEGGHAVTALARTPEKAASLGAQGATPVSVSPGNAEKFRRDTPVVIVSVVWIAGPANAGAGLAARFAKPMFPSLYRCLRCF